MVMLLLYSNQSFFSLWYIADSPGEIAIKYFSIHGYKYSLLKESPYTRLPAFTIHVRVLHAGNLHHMKSNEILIISHDVAFLMIFIPPYNNGYQGCAKDLQMVQSATDSYFLPSNATNFFFTGESVGTKHEARPLAALKALREHDCSTQFQ